jgi:hypothetical protein
MRTCELCPKDISDRPNGTKYCLPCSRIRHHKQMQKQRRKAHPADNGRGIWRSAIGDRVKARKDDCVATAADYYYTYGHPHRHGVA